MEEMQRRIVTNELPLFILGFRPFFLVASVLAVIFLGLWLGVFVFGYDLASYYGFIGWHSHEMVFGYTSAVIAGFLLTAVSNWTGIQTLEGKPLAALTTLWVTGRVLPFFPQLVPHWFIAVVDLSFIAMLTIAIAFPLLERRQVRNLGLVAILGLMFSANLFIHLDILEITENTAGTALQQGINLILLVIVIIGGRVIPFFTQRALPGTTPKRWPAIDWLAISSLLLLMLVELIWPASTVVAVIAALGAGIHLVRLLGWYTNGIWSVPLLWILHLGYGWLVLGLALKALTINSMVSTSTAVHAFTSGSIGVLTLGMMARVALGHTGRPLQPAKSIVLSFWLINLAALIRVVPPIFLPSLYIPSITVSGALWSLAFLIFCVVYIPIFLQPRVDTLLKKR